MTTEHVLINCEQHGEAYATFVCAHLAAEPLQEWFCDYPTEDNTWTDSWCAQCNTEFEKQGRWNEENADKLSIQLPRTFWKLAECTGLPTTTVLHFLH